MEVFDRRYFILNKIMLRSAGLWPYDDYKKNLCKRIFLNVVFGICVIFPQLMAMNNHWGVDPDLFLEHIAILFYMLTIYSKFLTSIYFENKIKLLYDNIALNWHMIQDVNEVNILIQYSENGRLLTIGYTSTELFPVFTGFTENHNPDASNFVNIQITVYMIMAYLLYVSFPMIPLLLDIIDPLNQTRSRFFILGGEHMIFDNNENYGKVYIFDSLACAVSVCLIAAVDSMYAASIEHCLGLIAIIKLRLQNCTKAACDGLKDDSYPMIIRLIRLHKDIIKFTDTLERSYSLTFLFLFALNLIFLSVECLMVIIRFGDIMDLMRYVMIMVGIVVHLFYISWPGQKLIDFSLGLLRDTYLNEWYACSIQSQKMLFFMTLRCSRPCKLTAGGIYVINVANFAKIVKTSLSYLTVLASFR